VRARVLARTLEQSASSRDKRQFVSGSHPSSWGASSPICNTTIAPSLPCHFSRLSISKSLLTPSVSLLLLSCVSKYFLQVCAHVSYSQKYFHECAPSYFTDTAPTEGHQPADFEATLSCVGSWWSQRDLQVSPKTTDYAGPICSEQCECYRKFSVHWWSVLCPCRSMGLNSTLNIVK
jgi:hypothetical protein